MATGQSLIRHDLRSAELPGFLALCEEVRRADVSFTNYETSLAVPGEPPLPPAWGDIPVKPSGPETLDCLAWMGFDLLSLANNHSYEGGPGGLMLTREVSAELGFTAAGTGATLAEAAAPSYRQVGGLRVGMVAMDTANLQTQGAIAGAEGPPGVNPLRGRRGEDGFCVVVDEVDLQRNLDSIAEASRNADVVVVSLHEHLWPEPDFFKVVYEPAWHEDWRPPMAWKRAFGRAAIDAGATMVFCHGMPRASAIEMHRGRPIFHGLGNFIFHASENAKGWVMPDAWVGFVAEIGLEGNEIDSIRLLPIRLMDRGGGIGVRQGDRVLPSLLHGQAGDEAIRHVVEDSARLGTGIVRRWRGWEVEVGQ
jgi:poly-gamma-glutamate capsule biosynthesis protein CapA/YwtB (metallophosphatase superfamily)